VDTPKAVKVFSAVEMMASARRWLAVGALAALAGCPAPETPPASGAGPPAERSALAAQVRGGRPSLLAGVAAPTEKKRIMKEVSAELGVECDYCHDVADFTAPTANKKIADFMYARYALGLAPRAGGVATCAACHRGRARFLGDRADRERVKQEMRDEMVAPFRTHGGGSVECATCHGDKLDQPFLPR